MKIVLSTLNARFVHSNLAIRYLKTYTEKFVPDLDIQLREFTINHHIDDIVRELYFLEPDVLGLSCYIWNMTATLEVVEMVKKINPECVVILGGPEVSFDSASLLKNNPYIDYILKGEGEKAFKDFVQALKTNQGFYNVPGLVYRHGGEIVENYPYYVEDLEKIPFPYENFAGLKNKIVYYESSRGCPFRCQYCLSSVSGKLRFLPMERVKQDLEELISYKPRQIKFVDRTFNCNKARALEIWKYLMEKDNGFTNFHFEICADLIDDEMLTILSRARTNLFQFEIGVQSTNEKTLDEIQRKMDFERIKTVVKQLRKQENIHLHLDLIAGLPFEGYDDFKVSFNDVFEMEPEMLQLGFLKLLKGSGLRRDASKHGYVFKDQPPYEVLKNNYIGYEEIVKLKLIEELVETYYNTHRFDTAIKFFMNIYETPFDFFEELAHFWHSKGYFEVSHSNEKLYKILSEFYEEKGDNPSLFKDILKLDYLLNNRHGKIFKWFNKNPIPKFKEKCFDFLKQEENIRKYMPEYIGQPPKKIYKGLRFEGFMYDVTQIFYNPKIREVKKSPTPLVFMYNTGPRVIKKARFYKIEL